MQLRPLKAGFRRPFTITPDEDVDVMENGAFVQVDVLAGDPSTVTINPGSTSKSITGFLNGVAVGDVSVQFTCDGHVGDGDVPVTLTVDFTVQHPDATVLGFSEGADEPIPAS